MLVGLSLDFAENEIADLDHPLGYVASLVATQGLLIAGRPDGCGISSFFEED